MKYIDFMGNLSDGQIEVLMSCNSVLLMETLDDNTTIVFTTVDLLKAMERSGWNKDVIPNVASVYKIGIDKKYHKKVDAFAERVVDLIMSFNKGDINDINKPILQVLKGDEGYKFTFHGTGKELIECTRMLLSELSEHEISLFDLLLY